MITRKQYLAAVKITTEYRLQEKKKIAKKLADKPVAIWKCKENLYMACSADLVFKKDGEYEQYQKSFIRGNIDVCDEKGDRHTIFTKGDDKMTEFIKNFTKIN